MNLESLLGEKVYPFKDVGKYTARSIVLDHVEVEDTEGYLRVSIIFDDGDTGYQNVFPGSYKILVSSLTSAVSDKALKMSDLVKKLAKCKIDVWRSTNVDKNGKLHYNWVFYEPKATTTTETTTEEVPLFE